MKFLLKIFISLALLFLIVPLGTKAASSLTIVPALFEETGLPGQVLKKKIKIINNDNEEKELVITAQDFIAKGEEGQQEFLAPDPERKTFSLTSWIKPEKESFVIGPNQEKEININIEIPASAEAGGHYAALFIGPKEATTTPGMVTTIGKIGSLFLLRIEGPITEKTEIKEFSSSASFYHSGPINFLLRLENQGNVHLKPKGKIEIKDIFNKKIEEIDANPKEGNVLPQSIRKYESSWNKKWMIGKYTALADISYGNSNQIIQKEISFWVIPVAKILIGLAILIVIIILLILIIKKYNQWIIKKAGHRTFSK